MSDLPKRVTINEEGPREGFQSEKKAIAVAEKVRLIEALAETGLKHIACVSYVNPKRVPSMADAEQVAAAIRDDTLERVERLIGEKLQAGIVVLLVEQHERKAQLRDLLVLVVLGVIDDPLQLRLRASGIARQIQRLRRRERAHLGVGRAAEVAGRPGASVTSTPA